MAGSTAVTLPDTLVSTDWLARNLGADGLLVFDCTCFLVPDPQTTLRAESGRSDYLKAHIPGAAFLDIADAFSDPDGRFRFTMPPPDRLARSFGAHGIADDSAVVLYAGENPGWATRFWWMLRVVGFDRAAVLDGGLLKWWQEDRPIDDGEVTFPAKTLTARPRPELVVGRDAVLAALDDPDTALVNALSAEQHRGEGLHYGRPGRIAGSTNLPYRDLLDPETGAFIPQDEIRSALTKVGAMDASRVVPYCGGGIAATVIAYWLTRLGKSDVALYDNSLSEWVSDNSLPMEAG